MNVISSKNWLYDTTFRAECLGWLAGGICIYLFFELLYLTGMGLIFFIIIDSHKKEIPFIM